MNFQDDMPSTPIDNFKDHYVLVFDLTSMQDATENCHCPELVGESLRLELNFTFRSFWYPMFWRFYQLWCSVKSARHLRQNLPFEAE